MKKYCIICTWKCNWKCDYCITDTHNHKRLKDQEVLDKVNNVEPNSEVSLSGGEPGFIKPELLEEILTILARKNCVVNVNTNGEFFKRFKPDERISNYFYHCSEYLTDYVKPIIEFDNVDYMIVVTDASYKNLSKFVKLNSHLKLHIFGGDKTQVKNKPGTSLSKMNALKLYLEYKDTNVFEEESLLYLFERCTVVNDKLTVL